MICFTGSHGKLEGSHGNLEGLMGTWKISRKPCNMSHRVSWELEGSHGNLKGLTGGL